MDADVAGTWTKRTSGAYEFELELRPDGTLCERDAGSAAEDTWTGSWECVGEEIRIAIGPFVSRLRQTLVGTLSGPEERDGRPNGYVTLTEHRPRRDELMLFVEQLIDDAVPAGLVPDVRRQMAADLHSRLEEWVNRRLLDAMNDEDLQTLDKLLDSDPEPSGIRSVTEAHVPDATHVVAKALLDFRALYLK